MIRTGELREQIVIEQPTETRDAFGGAVTSWGAFASPWAKVVTMTGQEALRATAMEAQHAVRFQMHWLPGLLPAMRIAWEGRLYDIREIDTSKRHQGELWLTAVAKVQ